MSEEKRQAARPDPPPHRGTLRSLPDHPVRIALLDLLAEVGTLTSTQAAARLGHSTGLCSFHLRQLARHGLIEEAPHKGGKQRPWQLRWESSHRPDQEAPEEFGTLARGLEDESYQQWLAHRDQAPAEWQREETFSAVVHLTPDEMGELAASVRRLLAPYAERDGRPAARPAGALAVAVVTRLFPLLTTDPVEAPEPSSRGPEESTGP